MLTDNEVQKALKCLGETIDFINRQKAEIEDLIKQRDEAFATARNAVRYNGRMRDKVNELEAENERLQEATMLTMADVHTAAIKEFAERLKEIYTIHEGLHIEIDNLVKELTEGSNGE